MEKATQLLIGFAAGVLVALAAYRAGSLSRSGAVTAAIMGGLVFGLGGLPWAVVLLTFFISSSALSRYAGPRKRGFSEKFSKGSRRDWAQVLANGGMGIPLVLLFAIFPDQPWSWFAFTGAMAAVNADTWATELGVLNPRPPRLITTGKLVEPGTSGGVSLLGALATFAGAALVGVAAAIFSYPLGTGAFWISIEAAVLGGVAGSLFDSWLGATHQAIYYCPACKKETERHPLHLCGSPTHRVRGWPWLNNDLVNLACSLVGAWVAVSAAIPFLP